MQVFLAGTSVTVGAEFTDSHGNALEVASATYRVLGHAGEELQSEAVLFGVAVVEPVPPEPLPEPEVPTDPEPEAPIEPAPDEGVQAFSLYGDPLAEPEPAPQPEPEPEKPTSLIVPAHLNEIAALDIDAIESEDMDGVNVRELRTVEFRLTLASGNVIVRKSVYALEPVDVLITGLNSFQSYPEAELVALTVPNLPGWQQADAQARIAALVEARLRILRLQFRDASRGQSYLNEEALIGDLSHLAPREFKSLSVRLRTALCRAQVAEADALLGGDPETERRNSGLVHETVGESTQSWRKSKPLELPVSKKALSYLAGFISMSRKMGRA